MWASSQTANRFAIHGEARRILRQAWWKVNIETVYFVIFLETQQTPQDTRAKFSELLIPTEELKIPFLVALALLHLITSSEMLESTRASSKTPLGIVGG